MLITLRMYKRADLDLLLLYDRLGKDFSKFVRECLKSFVRRTPLFFAGNAGVNYIPDHENIVTTKQMGINVSDADVLNALTHIRRDYRNNFIKNVVRAYAAPYILSAYSATKEGYERFSNAPVSSPVSGTPAFQTQPMLQSVTPVETKKISPAKPTAKPPLVAPHAPAKTPVENPPVRETPITETVTEPAPGNADNANMQMLDRFLSIISAGGDSQ